MTASPDRQTPPGLPNDVRTSAAMWVLNFLLVVIAFYLAQSPVSNGTAQTPAQAQTTASMAQHSASVLGFLGNLFDTSDFPARWHCGRWSSELGWLHIASDVAIFGAYFAIPIVLLYFLLSRKDLPFPKITWLFAAFILSCGIGHLVEAGIFWWPAYRLSGLVKAITAVVSWITVVVLIKVVPLALKLPSAALLAGKLQESQARLEFALEVARIGVWEWDANRETLQLDEATRKILGLTDASDQQLVQLWERIHPDDRERVQLHWKECAITNRPMSTEFRVFLQGEEVRHVRIQARIIETVAVRHLPGDTKPRFVGICRDVSERYRQDQILHHARTVAEEGNAAKSRFLAAMSHEIRTPLNGILGFTELLLLGVGTEQERKEYLKTILSSGRHLLALINDILDLSKIEAGRMEFERVPCAPHQVINEVLSTLRVSAQQKDLFLELRWTSGAPATILTDPARLRQLLMNIVGNAIKFTEMGGVRLIAWVDPELEEPRFTIEVHDTGIGIPPEQIERIFLPFDQGDSSVTRRFGGTGLGLAICTHIARGLGGTIRVESAPGRGSVFYLTLETGPLDLSQLQLEPPSEIFQVRPQRGFAEQLMLPAEEANTSQSVFQQARILVVEDGDTNRELIQLLLSEAGAEVVCAENGQLGVEAATRETFSLILMDMQMPVMDGYTAARRLREMGLDVPIIALTAHAMHGEDQKCYAAGCTGYLTKPIDINQLMQLAARALSGELRPAVKSLPS